MEEKKRRRPPQHLKPGDARTIKKTARPGRAPAARKEAGSRPEKGREPVRPVNKAAPKAVPREPARLSRSSRLFQETLLPKVEHTHRMNQMGLKIGVAWLLALPVLLAVIRRMTDSSKIAFLMVWIVGMFIIAAILVFVAYSDSELKHYLEELEKHLAVEDRTELGGLVDLESLPVQPEELREIIARRRRLRLGGEADPEGAEDDVRLRRIEEWITRIEQRREKESADAEHSADR
ncbi:MAG: hypothetical protein J5927_00855 [Oscillospiraceae bacterium]|nr:hypothetical protein [Oscillospiraceae bacterium]